MIIMLFDPCLPLFLHFPYSAVMFIVLKDKLQKMIFFLLLDYDAHIVAIGVALISIIRRWQMSFIIRHGPTKYVCRNNNTRC